MDLVDGCVLSLIPESGDPLDNAWQEECRRFSLSLKESNEITVAIQTLSSPDGARGNGLQAFNQIAVGVAEHAATAAVASRLWDLLTGWLQRRRGSTVRIRTSDGSEFAFNDLTKDEALRIFSMHLKRLPRGSS